MLEGFSSVSWYGYVKVLCSKVRSRGGFQYILELYAPAASVVHVSVLSKPKGRSGGFEVARIGRSAVDEDGNVVLSGALSDVWTHLDYCDSADCAINSDDRV